MLVSLFTIINEEDNLGVEALITSFFFTLFDSFIHNFSISLHDMLEGIFALRHVGIDLSAKDIIFFLYNSFFELFKILAT